MASFTRHKWHNPGISGLSRRDRRACDYETYIPDPLLTRRTQLDGEVAADVADAESAIAALNLQDLTLTNTEALARLLLRAESVASSQIEGLQVGGRRLLRAEYESVVEGHSGDITAAEVLGNIEAMNRATRAGSEMERISVGLLLDIHRELMSGTRLAEHAGKIRTEQNWIGGSSYNPCSAAYVPPPPEMVEGLLADLCEFCNQDMLPAVAQAAIAHAQFETIHPFVDGNGRIGRVLIHLILRRRGLAPRLVPPVSLILATWSRSYVEGLTKTRYLGNWDSKEAHEGINAWTALFATACRRAVEDATAFEHRVKEIQALWRGRLGNVRANSALDILISRIPGAPVISVSGAAELIGRSFQATNEAMQRLANAGIIDQINVGRRNRAFEVRDVIDAFTDLERRLASPAGDTLVSRPSRPSPPPRV